MEITKKILSIVLIILGSILIVSVPLTLITSPGTDSTDTAFLVGYYTGFLLIIIFGTVLIMIGIRIRKKIKNKKLKKDLLNSLPGDEN